MSLLVLNRRGAHLFGHNCNFEGEGFSELWAGSMLRRPSSETGADVGWELVEFSHNGRTLFHDEADALVYETTAPGVYRPIGSRVEGGDVTLVQDNGLDFSSRLSAHLSKSGQNLREAFEVSVAGSAPASDGLAAQLDRAGFERFISDVLYDCPATDIAYLLLHLDSAFGPGALLAFESFAYILSEIGTMHTQAISAAPATRSPKIGGAMRRLRDALRRTPAAAEEAFSLNDPHGAGALPAGPQLLAFLQRTVEGGDTGPHTPGEQDVRALLAWLRSRDLGRTGLVTLEDVRRAVCLTEPAIVQPGARRGAAGGGGAAGGTGGGGGHRHHRQPSRGDSNASAASSASSAYSRPAAVPEAAEPAPDAEPGSPCSPQAEPFSPEPAARPGGARARSGPGAPPPAVSLNYIVPPVRRISAIEARPLSRETSRQNVEGIALWAVREFLDRNWDRCSGRTTREVCYEIIKPATRGGKCAYLDLLRGQHGSHPRRESTGRSSVATASSIRSNSGVNASSGVSTNGEVEGRGPPIGRAGAYVVHAWDNRCEIAVTLYCLPEAKHKRFLCGP